MSTGTSTSTLPKVRDLHDRPCPHRRRLRRPPPGRHQGTGPLHRWTGTFTVAEKPEDSTLEATVQAASIYTSQEQRDEHLRTNDFLDVPNHPTLTLVSKGLRRVDDSNWVLTRRPDHPWRHQVGRLRPRVPRGRGVHAGGQDRRGLLGQRHHRPPRLRRQLQPLAARRQRRGGQQGRHRDRDRGRPGRVTSPLAIR